MVLGLIFPDWGLSEKILRSISRDPRERKLVGRLEVRVGDEVKETLKVRLCTNGRRYYKITGNPKSKVTNGTDVADVGYIDEESMKQYVERHARREYQSGLGLIMNEPPVSVEYLGSRQLLERDMERMEERNKSEEAVQYNI